jgi:hypothetical protein
MADFFISYTQDDEKWAEWIAQVLEGAEYSVIYQKRDFHAGENFVIEMDQGLASSDRVLAVLSPAYLASKYTPSEWGWAFAKDPTGRQRKLVTVKVKPCEPNGLLTAAIAINLVDLSDEEAKKVLLERVPPRGTPAEGPKPDEEAKKVLLERVPPRGTPAERPKPDEKERRKRQKGVIETISRRTWIVTAILVLLLAGIWPANYLVDRILLSVYRAQTDDLMELLDKNGLDITRADVQEMERLTDSLYLIQKKIGIQPDWKDTYAALRRTNPNVLKTCKIPEPAKEDR